MTLLQIASILLFIVFIYYGIQCLFSIKMKREFQRFGLLNYQRMLTGILQLFGAVSLFVGVFEPWIGAMASFGLGILMLLGFGVRIKIKDSFMETFPSFLFMTINFLVCAAYLKLIWS